MLSDVDSESSSSEEDEVCVVGAKIRPGGSRVLRATESDEEFMAYLNGTDDDDDDPDNNPDTDNDNDDADEDWIKAGEDKQSEEGVLHKIDNLSQRTRCHKSSSVPDNETKAKISPPNDESNRDSWSELPTPTLVLVSASSSLSSSSGQLEDSSLRLVRKRRASLGAADKEVHELGGKADGKLCKRDHIMCTVKEAPNYALPSAPECRALLLYDPNSLAVKLSALLPKAEPDLAGVILTTDVQDGNKGESDESKAVIVSTPSTSSQEEELDQNQDGNWTKEAFYGDVDRTVALLAASIRKMPKPGDDNNDKGGLQQLLPGLVPLYDHQEYALRWMTWREGKFPGGGILADEMGLGKTISIIALVMKSKLDEPVEYQSPLPEAASTNDKTHDRPMSGATLIICPMGCLRQWQEEIATKGRDLTVTVYHGSRKTTSAAALARFDIILSTYSTVGKHDVPKKDDRKKWDSPLKKLFLKRIILDEGHHIRNPKTRAALAICKLDAKYRWAVSGTPVHNRPEDFYSLVKFLRLVPFDDKAVWNFWIGLSSLELSRKSRQRLQTIGRALILRRTKAEVKRAGGNVVATIPNKTVVIVEVDLSEGENRLYQNLVTYSRQLFKKYLSAKKRRERGKEQGMSWMHSTPPSASGTDSSYYSGVGSSEEGSKGRFMKMLVLITRLRQCAVHPSLMMKGLENKEEAEVSSSFNEQLLMAVVSKRDPVIEEGYESAKFKKILQDLEELRRQAQQEDRGMDKVVIVSSWTTLLNILNEHLKRGNFSTTFITGRQGSKARSEAQKAFNNQAEPQPQIVLLSLRAGGEGLNLVVGNHVFFVEPHWNPQMELQAQDRVHRLGQTKDVFIRRYITTGSIENRIVELQDMKKELAEGVLNSRKTEAGAGLSLAQMKHLFNIEDIDLCDSDDDDDIF